MDDGGEGGGRCRALPVAGAGTPCPWHPVANPVGHRSVAVRRRESPGAAASAAWPQGVRLDHQ